MYIVEELCCHKNRFPGWFVKTVLFHSVTQQPEIFNRCSCAPLTVKESVWATDRTWRQYPVHLTVLLEITVEPSFTALPSTGLPQYIFFGGGGFFGGGVGTKSRAVSFWCRQAIGPNSHGLSITILTTVFHSFRRNQMLSKQGSNKKTLKNPNNTNITELTYWRWRYMHEFFFITKHHLITRPCRLNKSNLGMVV